jgi:hypothetical protein
MIYRILIDSVAYLHDPQSGNLYTAPSGTRMRGVFTAGFSEGLGDIPFPRVTNPRARFYFTEAGWTTYGRNVAAAARRHGHAVRVIRRKNPSRSRVVYRDAYQVAVLPLDGD